MPQYGGDLVQSAPSGSAIRELQVPTIVDRDRLSSTGVVRAGGRAFVDADGVLYEWNGVAWLVVPENAPALQVATHNLLATIPTPQLTPGDVWLVDSDGTQWTYTGTEPAAPDPSVEAAWDIAGAAPESWFADPLFPSAETRTVYVDQSTGSDVFNSGAAGQPWRTPGRAMDQIPEKPGEPLRGATFGITYVVEFAGGAKADLTRLTPKFALTTAQHVVFLGERAPVDLDGIGTTEFAAAVFNRDLSGPVVSGGTVAKRSQYRLGVGVTVLASVQQPASDGLRWLHKESDFGFAGFRSFTPANNCRVHDSLAVMAAQDIGLAGGGFGSGHSNGDVANVLSPYVTQVDGSISFASWDLDGALNACSAAFIGIDFATDIIANSRSNRNIRGIVQLKACKFKVGGQQGQLDLYPAQRFVGTQQPLAGCTVVGEGSADALSLVRSRSDSVPNGASYTANVFVDAALVLREGTHEPYTNVYRGNSPPAGNNSSFARLVVGADSIISNVTPVVGCFSNRTGGDFEREPGAASPMSTGDVADNGACVLVVGAATLYAIGGSQGPSTVDCDGRYLQGAYRANLIPQANATFGESTRPIRLRHGCSCVENNFTGKGTANFSPLTNNTGGKAIPGGGDVQFGIKPAGSPNPEFVLDNADLPNNDLGEGAESEGIVWR